MPDFVAAYDDTRQRLTDLLRSTSPDGLQTKVPACPAWTVKDLLAHLVHIAETYAVGDAPYTTPDIDVWVDRQKDRAPAREVQKQYGEIDRWTQGGVDARSRASLDDLIDEWDANNGRLFAMMRGEVQLPPGRSNETLSVIVTNDLSIHYQDIRGALVVGPDRDTYGNKLAYAGLGIIVETRARERSDVPSLRITTQRGRLALGSGEPRRTLELDWFELLRVMSGRRSLTQTTELLGDIDVEPYLDLISWYPYASEPLAV